MLDLSRNTAFAIAGLCGTAFIGYCIYFDKKRRSDPDFKKKLRESKFRVSGNRSWMLVYFSSVCSVFL